MANVDTHISC